jgi:cytochrome c553
MRRLIVLLGLAACSGPPPIATAVDAQRAHVELADLEHGRTLLVAKCGGCHQVPLPSEHTAHDWPIKLGEMSARAKLDDEQRRSIEKYLVVMAPR